MNSPFLDALADRVLVWDGAMGTQIQNSGLDNSAFQLPTDSPLAAVQEARHRLGDTVLDGCNELLNLTSPKSIQSIHERYLEAGSDLIETNTFGSTSIVLAEFDIPNLTFDLSKAAAQIAKQAAQNFSTPTKPRFVAGAIGPGTKLVSLGQTTWAELENTYCDSFKGLIEGGADFLMLETLQDLLMVKAGVVAANRAMAECGKQLPLVVQVTMEQTGTMLLGSEFGAALCMLESLPNVIAIGMNCATGPAEMEPHLRFLHQNSTRPLSVQPNAGLPVMEKGRAVYKLTPEELGAYHVRFIEQYGVAMVGGCCGTTPEHLAAVARAVEGKKPSPNAHWMKSRELFPGFDFTLRSVEQDRAIQLKGAASLYQFQPYVQDSSFLIVGERTNANGSKLFRDCLAQENWEALVDLAKEQEAEGSHVVDVCTAYVGRDESRDMGHLLGLLNQSLTIPIMIDSTEVPVIEKALQTLAGKPIINSINFEDGETRSAQVLSLCRKYGAAVVGLTIDEDGMAKTVEKKVAIAERILARCREYGVPEHDVFIDCLTFTLGSGDEEFRLSAEATIDAIRELRQSHPTLNLLLGVSNVSFGLKPAARQVLNSVFLHYAQEAGLNSAIVHFSKILPENKVDAEVWKIASDLVFDRREYATA